MTLSCKHLRACLLAPSLILHFSLSMAAENTAALSTLTVVGQQLPATDNAGHRSYFDRFSLDAFAGQDGSLDNLYRQVPGLQFSEGALDASQLSELRPESISISGGRAYENLFSLDGLSFSSRIDPANNNHSAINDVSGHDQGLFIDSELIESIEVYSSNIPAEYSGFTGGVINMETRQPDPERIRGSVFYGVTRSEWVDYRLFIAQPDDDAAMPIEPPESPEFKRERFGATISLPYQNNAGGLLISATRSQSRTSDLSLNQSKDQRQENSNLLLKSHFSFDDTVELDASINYSPFHHRLFIRNAQDSDYRLEGDGLAMQARLNYFGHDWDHTFQIGFSEQQNNRSAPRHFYNWANTHDRNWGQQAGLDSSRQGGFGDLNKFSNRTHLRWLTQRTGYWGQDAPWGLRTGFDFGYQTSGFERPETTYVYQNPVTNSLIQCRGQQDCVQGQQYFTQRQVYQAQNVEVGLADFGAHIEFSPRYQRLSGRLGLRYDRDTFLDRNNWAPRLSISADVFGNNATQVNFGANRYYSSSLLTYKLREASAPHYAEYRGASANIVRDWQENIGSGRYRYRFDDVTTPYADELTLGLTQQLEVNRLNLGQLTFNATQRWGRNELARTQTETLADGYRYYLMNNDGSSEYWGLSIGWERQIDNTNLRIHATTSRTRTTNADYDTAIDHEAQNDWVFLDEQRIRRGELDILREDFARNWVVNTAISHQVFEGLQVSANFRYLGKTPRIYNTQKTRQAGLMTLPSGEIVPEILDVYAEDTRPAVTQVDLKTRFHYPFAQHQGLTLEVETRNVFNQRTHRVPPEQTGIETGRSWWLMLRMDF